MKNHDARDLLRYHACDDDDEEFSACACVARKGTPW